MQPSSPTQAPREPVVYVVDDDDSVRESLVWLVESVGRQALAFRGAQEFLNAYDPAQPGCLILDIRMPVIGGLDLQERLRQLDCPLPIIFITGHGDVPMSVRAMKKGAFDFVQKPYNYQDMLDTIEAALRAGAEALERARQRTEAKERLATLTPREHAVLTKLVEGKSSKIIAFELGISAKTVEIYRTNIREKLATDSVAQMVRMVLSTGG